LSFPDQYPSISHEVRLLAIERLHGSKSIAGRRGFTLKQKREALLLVLNWNPHHAFWKNEQLIIYGLNKNVDLSEERIQIKVPLNIQTRKPRIQIKRKSKPLIQDQKGKLRRPPGV
jgi:hypothetical protein